MADAAVRKQAIQRIRYFASNGNIEEHLVPLALAHLTPADFQQIVDDEIGEREAAVFLRAVLCKRGAKFD